jgi:RNA polymerase sigma-70 factor (ECF subfamily)
VDEPDGALLERAYAGDEGAFLGLYERHRRPLFRFAYRMLGSVPVAEDLVHECFLVLLTHPGRYDAGRASLRTFLGAVARNLAFKQLRRRGVETATDELPDTPEPAPEAPGPLRLLLEGERCAAVQEAVASLPPLQREVVILFEYEGHSLAEVAEVVAADVGTVKARLHRARERLRKALAPWLAGSSPEAAIVSAARRRPLERMV